MTENVTNTKEKLSRMPVVLLLDTSSVMKDRLGLLHEELNKFKHDVESDELAQRHADIAVVGFGGNISLLQDFTAANEFTVPPLDAQGPTLMIAGIMKAFALIESRKHYYVKNGIPFEKPVIILFAGSKPEDFAFKSKARNEIEIKIETESRRNELYFYTIYLEERSDNVIEETYSKGSVVDITSVDVDEGGDTAGAQLDSWEIINFNDVDIQNDVKEPFSNPRILSTVMDLSYISPNEFPLMTLNNKWNYGYLLSRPLIDSMNSINSNVERLNHTVLAEKTQQNDEYAKAGWQIMGRSEIGPLHVWKGIPCQDAFASAILPTGHGIIAVADGLGSVAKSEIGSWVAVEAGVNALLKMTNEELLKVDMVSLTQTSVRAARKALEEKKEALACTLRELACTFITIVMYEDNVAVAHIGDGAVVLKTGDGLQLASGPGDSEYANEVTPLTSKAWEKALRQTPIISNVLSVMAFTDGLQRAALKKSQDGYSPFDKFCNPLLAYASEVTDVKEAEKEISDMLSSKKIADNSEDDKTLIMAYLSVVEKSLVLK
jgi:uncharacterized protein YegL